MTSATPDGAARGVGPPVADRDDPSPPWGRRLLARLLDLAVVATIVYVIAVSRVVWFLRSWAQASEDTPWGAWLPAQVLAVIVSGALEVAFLRMSAGQTPGRERMRIRVERRDGTDPGVAIALRRWASTGVALATPALWPGLLVLAASGLPVLWRRRSLADVLAGTRTVRFDRDSHDRSLGRSARPFGRPRTARWGGASPDQEQRSRPF